MDKILKQKWVEALRSGEFKQCTGTLYKPSENAYCCWGVLRHLADPSDVRGKGTLTNAQLVEYGLGPFYHTEVLENMNDGLNEEGSKTTETKRHTFAEIADYIEKNL